MSKSSNYREADERRKNPKRREEHREERRVTRQLLEQYKRKIEMEDNLDERTGGAA